MKAFLLVLTLVFSVSCAHNEKSRDPMDSPVIDRIN